MINAFRVIMSNLSLYNHVFVGPPTLTVDTLTTELGEVKDWEMLGVSLGIPRAKLHAIKIKRNGDGHLCKIDLFDRWLHKDPEANWLKSVQALIHVGEYDELTVRLYKKYRGVTISKCVCA